MTNAGIVESKRGNKGGYKLTKDISFYDMFVILSVAKEPGHDVLSMMLYKAEKKALDELKKWTLARIVKEGMK